MKPSGWIKCQGINKINKPIEATEGGLEQLCALLTAWSGGEAKSAATQGWKPGLIAAAGDYSGKEHRTMRRINDNVSSNN